MNPLILLNKGNELVFVVEEVISKGFTFATLVAVVDPLVLVIEVVVVVAADFVDLIIIIDVVFGFVVVVDDVANCSDFAFVEDVVVLDLDLAIRESFHSHFAGVFSRPTSVSIADNLLIFVKSLTLKYCKKLLSSSACTI